jgi:shikimate kinase
MRILLWGIPCVGHETVGKLLAKKMNYEFIDQTDIIKKKYGTIDKFNELYPIDYYRFKIKEDIAFDVINSKNNFVMAMSFICAEEIVKKITDTDTISIEITDNLENIYDRILFYDENDEVKLDSKEYRDKHKQHYINVIKNDMTTSNLEFKNIPKFCLDGRNFEDVLYELVEFINNIKNDKLH